MQHKATQIYQNGILDAQNKNNKYNNIKKRTI